MPVDIPKTHTYYRNVIRYMGGLLDFVDGVSFKSFSECYNNTKCTIRRYGYIVFVVFIMYLKKKY